MDTLGLVLEVVVTPADVPDRDMGWWLLERMAGRFLRLERVWVDSNYAGALEEIARTHYGRVLEIVKAAAETVGFAVQPHRWIVMSFLPLHFPLHQKPVLILPVLQWLKHADLRLYRQ